MSSGGRAESLVGSSWLEALDRLAGATVSREEAFARLSALAKEDPKSASPALAIWLNLRREHPRPEAKYFPLYHLLIERWRSESRSAFESAEDRLSFSDLDLRVRARASVWSRQGVGPGLVVALGRSFGVELLLDLLTVFRLGACAAWIPPYGQPFEEAGLRAVEPDFLCAVDESSALVTPRALSLEMPAHPRHSRQLLLPAPADYGAQQPCLLVISPLTGDPSKPELAAPSALSAAELLLALGRDAALLWGLRDGDWMSAPGLDDRRHQPFLTLATWLVGAGYHFLRQEELEGGGPFKPYRAFGVSSATRDALLRSGSAPGASRWFRVLEEGTEEPGRWLAWQRRPDAGEESCAVALDPSLGGVALAVVQSEDTSASPEQRRVEMAHVAVGLEWKLQPLPGAAPDDGVGLLLFEDARAAPPSLLMSEGEEGLRFLGALEPRRRGQVFPGGITSSVVERLPGVLGASVVPVPRRDASGAPSFGLMVFVSASVGVWSEERRAATRGVISRHVERVLHAELRPDFVEVYPIAPRRSKDGAVDVAWVQAERWSGGLGRRSRGEVFRRLASLGLSGSV